MISRHKGETLSQAIKRTCAERGHDFYRSHRCWNCNIPYHEVHPEPESFNNDSPFTGGMHMRGEIGVDKK